MKVALLKGNRFNPWHLRVFNAMNGVEPVAFRAESEIQSRFEDRDDGSAAMPVETIYFDTQTGGGVTRAVRKGAERLTGRAPRIVPFAERLAGFDLIQTWELFTQWTEQALDARKTFGVPVAVMVWDNIAFNHESDARAAATKARAVAEADVFLVHTERSRRMLWLEGVEDARIRLLPPGVDTELFRPGPRDRSRFGFDDHDWIILFVGWLLPRKGVDYLLQALRLLIDEHAADDLRIRLHIVGSGPGRERVDDLIARLGLKQHISFTDGLPYGEMPAVYRAADVFVLPSIATETWQEQFGMAMMEAMACSVPVVASRSGAITEIAGDAARLCQPNDFCSLQESLSELKNDETRARALAESGRARMAARYSLPTAAAALSGVYGSLVDD